MFLIMKSLDSIDMKILEVLSKNSDFSVRKLSKKLLIPITTVHHRLKKLKQSGIIKNYSINLDHKKLGNDICAYILIKIDYNILKQKKLTQQEIAKKLKYMGNIEDIALITGARDILLKVRTKNISELNKFITKDLRSVESVESTETLMVLDEIFD